MKKKGIRNSTQEGQPALYLFYGDEFLVKEKVQELVDSILTPELRETNLVRLDGVSLDVGHLSSVLFTPSLFGDKRVILVDQTTVFMGRADHKKFVPKVVESWKAGDQRSSLRAFSQLLSVVGIERNEIEVGHQWISEILGKSASSLDRDVFRAVAAAFLDQPGTVAASRDEDVIKDLILSPFPEGTVLILTALDVDKRKKIFKVVSQKAQIVECVPLEQRYGSGLDKKYFEDRVRKALAESGKTISSRAIEAMYARSGREMRRLHAELHKLSAYVGDRKEVTVEDVENVFSDFHEASFFELTNALRSGNIEKCLPSLHEHLKLGAHPLQTLAVIASDFRKLMVARELLFTVFRSSWKRGMSYDEFKHIAADVREEHPELVQKGKFNLLSMNDYPLYVSLRDVQKFPMDKLTRIMEAILEADVMIKSSRLGSRSPESILESVVLTICAPANATRSKIQRGITA